MWPVVVLKKLFIWDLGLAGLVTYSDTTFKTHILLASSISNLNFIILVEATDQCQIDNECQTDEVCYQGSCQKACRFTKCGPHAYCTANLHETNCKCYPKYGGNPPSIACKPSKHDRNV